jgi:hypothetical protein
MKKLFSPRVVMALAGLSLAVLFLTPMWKIILKAPQYPNGVQLDIWIDKIGGEGAALQNINILNHYIGMKYIEPDAIAELSIFPYIVGGMIALALIALLINNSWVYFSWALIMILLSIAGFYDFYLWEYDYGHNLSDTAPIKIPGASFQPPLIGSKKIINFTAISLPHIGGYFAGLSILFSLLAWRLKLKFNKNENFDNSDADHVDHLDVVHTEA